MESKYHRVYAKVDLDAIKSNFGAIKTHLISSGTHHNNGLNFAINEPVKIMAVIKADGYGHGAIPIGRELELLGIDYIAVAIFQEGIQLRKEGIKTPILVLGNTPKDAYPMLLEFDLIQTIYSVHMGLALDETAARLNVQAKIHVKIDTGMGRIGIRAINQPIESVIEQFSQLFRSKNLEVKGIFTHFAKADEADKSYTQMQINLFNQLLNRLHQEDMLPELIHASNSAGLIDVHQANYSMVRAGIALYGLYPSDEVDHTIQLTPALSIKSHVVFVKTVGKGESISYGGIFTTEKETIIATIPIGYADGYSRALSNKGRVVIRGQYAPVIGRVCMDQILVDVTHIEGVCENDDVYLIGGTQEAFVSVEDIAKLMQTINYEVICLIGKRVPRVYVKDNEIVETIDYFYN
jgi:alanine racemase